MVESFALAIEQDRSRGDPVKTEYDEDQGAALVESDEEAVDLRSTALLRMAAKHSAAILRDKAEDDCRTCASRHLRPTYSEKRSFELWDRPANGSAKSRKD